MIPKTIFSVWLNDVPGLPDLAAHCIASHNIPGYEHRLVTLPDILAGIVPHVDYVDECLNARIWIKAADYVRMQLLYEYGGIYLDADMGMLPDKTFDDLLDCRLFTCLESTGYLSNAVVGAEAKHPALAGRPLRPGILYGVDTRASAEVADLEQELGRGAIFKRSALHLSSQAAGPKILWLRRHKPDVWARTETILTGSGYLVFKLTGEKVIDAYTATAYAPLFDVHTCTWSAEMARPITPPDKLPRVAWSAEVVGEVTTAASKETGLAAGTPVVAGTADAAAEALSAGLATPGDLMVMVGSSIFFIQKTARLVATDKLWAAVFLEEGAYVVAGGMSTGGSLTRWFRDHLSPQEVAAEAAGGPNAYEALAHLAATAPLGSKGLVILPYFAGERTPIHDPEARGLIAGLTLAHTRADLYRALLESVGYGIRHNVDTMREMGIPPRRILAVGGGTRNPLWLQIVSDIAGVEQLIPTVHHGACYGDAFLAGVGVGLFANTSQVTAWVRHRAVVRPDPDAHSHYESYYRIYRQLYEDSVEAVHQLARLAVY